MAAAIAVIAKDTVQQNGSVVCCSRVYALLRCDNKNISIKMVTLET
jgi:hypothetical protein